jgi:HSP20 family protein
MTVVRRPSPFGELVSLRQAMDRLFEDSFVRPGQWSGRGWAFGSDAALPLDVTRDKETLRIEAALPGIRPEDVQITVENGTLTISAETSEERNQKNDHGEVLVQEIRRGSVSRSIALPSGLEPDKANATFEHGVLRLEIPVAETFKPRQIRISPTTNGQHRTLESGDGQAADAGNTQGA